MFNDLKTYPIWSDIVQSSEDTITWDWIKNMYCPFFLITSYFVWSIKELFVTLQIKIDLNDSWTYGFGTSCRWVNDDISHFWMNCLSKQINKYITERTQLINHAPVSCLLKTTLKKVNNLFTYKDNFIRSCLRAFPISQHGLPGHLLNKDSEKNLTLNKTLSPEGHKAYVVRLQTWRKCGGGLWRA